MLHFRMHYFLHLNYLQFHLFDSQICCPSFLLHLLQMNFPHSVYYRSATFLSDPSQHLFFPAKYLRLLRCHSVHSGILPVVFLSNLSLVSPVARFLPWMQSLPHHLLSACHPPASQPSVPVQKYLHFQILLPAQMPRSVKKGAATPVKM